MEDLVRKAFPEHEWRPWLFRSSSSWKTNASVLKTIVARILSDCDLKHPEEILTLTKQNLRATSNGRALLSAGSGSVIEPLKLAFPDMPWPESTKGRIRRRWTTAAMRQFFAGFAQSHHCEIPALASFSEAEIEVAGGNFVRSLFSANLLRALKHSYVLALRFGLLRC